MAQQSSFQKVLKMLLLDIYTALQGRNVSKSGGVSHQWTFDCFFLLFLMRQWFYLGGWGTICPLAYGFRRPWINLWKKSDLKKKTHLIISIWNLWCTIDSIPPIRQLSFVYIFATVILSTVTRIITRLTKNLVKTENY